jgi:hypothetical protein
VLRAPCGTSQAAESLCIKASKYPCVVHAHALPLSYVSTCGGRYDCICSGLPSGREFQDDADAGEEPSRGNLAPRIQVRVRLVGTAELRPSHELLLAVLGLTSVSSANPRVALALEGNLVC